jgi:hypothetical protein
MNIDFTTTAMGRPEIFRQTLESFHRNLKGINLWEQTLYLNVDPVPPEKQPQVLDVAADYFKVVKSNSPVKPSFPAAVKWCWSQPTTELFFHLEDDWELVKPVDINTLILPFTFKDKFLTVVNLRAYHWVHLDGRMCLSPGLWRTPHAKVLSQRLRLTANPEKQLRRQSSVNPEGGKHGGYMGRSHTKDVNDIVIRDLGREWLLRSGYKKPDSMYFTNWVSSVS